jgi:hypothetical protein
LYADSTLQIDGEILFNALLYDVDLIYKIRFPQGYTNLDKENIIYHAIKWFDNISHWLGVDSPKYIVNNKTYFLSRLSK